MPTLAVEITRFVDPYQPGFVECMFLDAQGCRHLFMEKLPIVTRADLWSSSAYPQPGAIPCEVEAEWLGEQGRAVVRVTTERPFHVESTSGQSSFVVLSVQVQQ
jgi:hypothetical protein